MIRHWKHLQPKKRNQTGMTLVDTMITAGIVVIVACGVIELFAMALSRGTEANSVARSAEYARDKMEQLLRFCGNGSRAAQARQRTSINVHNVESAVLPGCTDRTSARRIPVTGGGLDIAKPLSEYVDYLDADGQPVASTAHWEYVRVWQISTPPGGSASTKEIAVKAQSRRVGTNGVARASTIVTTRSFPLN